MIWPSLLTPSAGIGTGRRTRWESNRLPWLRRACPSATLYERFTAIGNLITILIIDIRLAYVKFFLPLLMIFIRLVISMNLFYFPSQDGES